LRPQSATHQGVRTRLNLGRRVIAIVGAGGSRRNDITADVCVGDTQELHRIRHGLLALNAIFEQCRMPLVPHHAAHLEPACTRSVGEASGPFRGAPAARQADVHVDQNFPHAARDGRVDRGFGVDGDRDPPVDGPEPRRIEHFVRQQEIVAETGPRQPFHLGDGGAGKAAVAVGRLPKGERGAFMGLHVRAQAFARHGLRHRVQVLFENLGVHDEGRRLQVMEVLHGCSSCAGDQSLAARPVACASEVS